MPEFTSLSEVDYLEKHDAPELFLLLEGKVVLVLSEDGAELREVPMERGKLYVVTEWHNAYRPGNCRGVALVVERTGISTTYKKLK